MECSPFIMEFHRGSEMSETLLVIISILLLLMLLLIVFFYYHIFYKKTDASFYFKITSILRKNALLTGKDRAGIPTILV